MLWGAELVALRRKGCVSPGWGAGGRGHADLLAENQRVPAPRWCQQFGSLSSVRSLPAASFQAFSWLGTPATAFMAAMALSICSLLEALMSLLLTTAQSSSSFFVS